MRSTITSLTLLGALAVSTAVWAQNTTNDTATSPGTAAGHAMDNTLGTNTTGTNPNGANAGQNAAAGDSNQAIATTTANAAQPAHGANSFSQGEAQGRISNRGFQNVSNLKLDQDGVWHGSATKDGQQVGVWLDYKGNVGQQ
jgi:hypothetical protein